MTATRKPNPEQHRSRECQNRKNASIHFRVGVTFPPPRVLGSVLLQLLYVLLLLLLRGVGQAAKMVRREEDEGVELAELSLVSC